MITDHRKFKISDAPMMVLENFKYPADISISAEEVLNEMNKIEQACKAEQGALQSISFLGKTYRDLFPDKKYKAIKETVNFVLSDICILSFIKEVVNGRVRTFKEVALVKPPLSDAISGGHIVDFAKLTKDHLSGKEKITRGKCKNSREPITKKNS